MLMAVESWIQVPDGGRLHLRRLDQNAAGVDQRILVRRAVENVGPAMTLTADEWMRCSAGRCDTAKMERMGEEWYVIGVEQETDGSRTIEKHYFRSVKVGEHEIEDEPSDEGPERFSVSAQELEHLGPATAELIGVNFEEWKQRTAAREQQLREQRRKEIEDLHRGDGDALPF
jgi:hypothetical protein